jgi:hypothetical protein
MASALPIPLEAPFTITTLPLTSMLQPLFSSWIRICFDNGGV